MIGRSVPCWARVLCWARGVVLLAACLSLARPVPASATVLLPVSFDEMARASQVIVRGRVIDVRSQLVGARRTIESLVSVQVVDTFKGAPRSVVVFRLPGGQVGRYRRVTIGVPVFTAGDEVILFLKGHAPALPIPFGLSQGVYRVVHRVGGRSIVTQPPAAAAGAVRGDPARRPLALAAFARHLRAVLGDRP